MEPNYVFKASFRYLESYRTRMQTVSLQLQHFMTSKSSPRTQPVLAGAYALATANSVTTSQTRYMQKWQLFIRSGKSQF